MRAMPASTSAASWGFAKRRNPGCAGKDLWCGYGVHGDDDVETCADGSESGVLSIAQNIQTVICRVAASASEW